jgi:hypothetical protein
MKTANGVVFQGDLMLSPVAKPNGAKFSTENGEVVLAHSETGHHHVVDGKLVKVWRQDAMTCYLSLTEPVDIVHKRPFDTHETIRLMPMTGKVWRVRRQREHTPEGWRRVED